MRSRGNGEQIYCTECHTTQLEQFLETFTNMRLEFKVLALKRHCTVSKLSVDVTDYLNNALCFGFIQGHSANV
jgi:hypothetical protein